MKSDYCQDMLAGFENDMRMVCEGRHSLLEVYKYWVTHPDFHQITSCYVSPALVKMMDLPPLQSTVLEALYIAVYREGAAEA